MQERTKAQLTIGLLAFFAGMWIIVEQVSYSNIIYALGIIILLLVIMLVLSYVIIALLDWVKVFDLKTNAILTLLVLTTFIINLKTILNLTW